MINIIPNSIPPGAVTVRPVEFQIRTMLEYDTTFLQDRIRADVFVNGKPVGVYSTMRLDEDVTSAEQGRAAIEKHGAGLERAVVDEFMGLDYRREIRELQYEVNKLKAYLNRPRWFHFNPVRRFFWGMRRGFWAIRARLAIFISPKGNPVAERLETQDKLPLP